MERTAVSPVSMYSRHQSSPSPDLGLEKITEEKRSKVCIFCKRSTVNEVKFGTLYSRDDVTCHYFCLLFCCNLPQNGEDSDGILGFLTTDIKKEVKRVNGTERAKGFYKCVFCTRPGATIGCFVDSCSAIYHFPCGFKHGINFRFTSNFDSYCPRHATPVPFHPDLPCPVKCRICANDFKGKNPSQRPIRGLCCPNAYHADCLQMYALSAGYFFKCPVCADKDTFIGNVQAQGIFVPERDAIWEKEPDAYSDLKQLYSTCDAEKCICPSGRNYVEKDVESSWRIFRCYDCAASGIHSGCSDLPYGTARWICPICKAVETRPINRVSQEVEVENKTPESESDLGDETAAPDSSDSYSSSAAETSDDDCSDSDSSSPVSSDESLFEPIKVPKRQTEETPSKSSDIQKTGLSCSKRRKMNMTEYGICEKSTLLNKPTSNKDTRGPPTPPLSNKDTRSPPTPPLSTKDTRGPPTPSNKDTRGPPTKDTRGPPTKDTRGPPTKDTRGPPTKDTRGPPTPSNKDTRGPPTPPLSNESNVSITNHQKKEKCDRINFRKRKIAMIEVIKISDSSGDESQVPLLPIKNSKSNYGSLSSVRNDESDSESLLSV